ncbi:MAG: ATP-grasp domain-containing protein [Planctomycetota bacterium]|nr:MAG: ATP-grasp domain-containing protein [Planctomycetota bacterium]REJ98538.1 MAG: ATP-grasp domain-containing protein [Planctomycetota bacterium]REK29838.1 MAG: ATP-grasp domain-containing protein [Planctomycetota bacterium]REK47991.1 MAG: ATP-grasp domain-containing protein [Planctomycetota bacterium]
MFPSLTIVGASTRAAAFSALAAGWQPHCADLFADVDLQARAPVTRVANYPRGLPLVVEQMPEGPWMYTGALENHPEVVERIAGGRRLLGNPAAVLREVRDPLLVAQRLRGRGLGVPAVTAAEAGLPRDGSWLRKRRRGSGGGHVVPWDHHVAAQGGDQAEVYYQQRVEGAPHAAVFLASSSQCELWGVTRQLIGAPWTSGAAYRYCGSVGPVSTSAHLTTSLRSIGQAIVDHFGLRGIFGVDVVLAGDHAWLIEINPRYPASAEILERATGTSAVGLHVAACGQQKLELTPYPGNRVCGKAIVFAAQATTASPTLCAWVDDENRRHPGYRFADLPGDGTPFPAQAPVLTVFADAANESLVVEQLRHRVEAVQNRLTPCLLEDSAPGTHR